MKKSIKKEVDSFMAGVIERNPHQEEYQQAIREFVETVMPWYLEQKPYRDARILDRLTEPDRIISFRVTWEDDKGRVQMNRAWRVQFNNDLGPYKGGLRFHSGLTVSVLKFLAFEQVFKNALTGLPMGGAKGGANFNPRGRSDREIMRFCHAMMDELHTYIGEDVDVPAGDINVGTREISYLFGRYNKLQNRWSGAVTGKSSDLGGSFMRKEATGYGCIYFCEQALDQHNLTLLGHSVGISGSGNVALYAAEKALDRGARVVTLSDSDGTVYFPQGLNREELPIIKSYKEEQRERLGKFYQELTGAEYHAGKKSWAFPCDVALPCATQNELDLKDAKMLIKGGTLAVCEGANMPCTSEAAACLRASKIVFTPGKASNAGGVAVSGLEQSQNSMRVTWSRDEVDQKLQTIMKNIHAKCVEYGSEDGTVDYVAGANLAALSKVAKAIHAYGIL